MKFKILGAIVFFFILFWSVKYAVTWDIWDAVRNNRVTYIQDYLKHGGDVNLTKTIVHEKAGEEYVYTLLMEAARHGSSDVVSMLIQHGADINGNTTFRNTPLVFAIENKNNKIKKRFYIGKTSHYSKQQGICAKDGESKE